MELTLSQALQMGVEAHKAGQVQEADRYYTAILKANPKHPDANHNMGVLAVGVGKVEVALPFFKTALETNPKIAQYWLSYIDAFIKLERMADAKAVFDQAKQSGAKGEKFNKLEVKLSQSMHIDDETTSQKELDKAIEFRENGKYEEAIDLLLDQTRQSPTNPNILATLSHCYILNDNLEQAIIYLEKAKNINPDLPSVGWNETRLLLKQKKVDEALAVAKKTNKLFPDDVEGMGILGSCFRATDNFDKSLKYLNKAIKIDPNYAEALINRGLIYLNNKDNANALTDLEKAYKLKPHVKQLWGLLIGLIIETKNYSKAISFLVRMIEVDPNDEKIYSLLALCNQEADDPALAIESFEKILDFRPNDAVMHLNLGKAFKKKNEDNKAVENYSKAISIRPDFAEVYNSMAIVLVDQGKLEEAIEALNKAISLKPDYAEAYRNMGRALSGIVLNKPNRDLQKSIVSLLDRETYIRPRYIAKASISLVKSEPALKKYLKLTNVAVIANPSEVISELCEFPLLIKLMSVCPLPDPELEGLLTKLRCSILNNISFLSEANPKLIEFQSALALQCFTNEYVYDTTKDEEKLIQSLDASIKKSLKSKEQPSANLVLALAAYKALNQYEWCDLLVKTDHIDAVVTRQVEEPYEEEKLKKRLPTLGKINDTISLKVREQYEKSPYPRWVKLGLPPKPLSIFNMVEEANLKLQSNKITKVNTPEILVAGCGTGQHSIGTATRFESSKILAVDLSLSSLAYAKRKTEELGIENITYMQADILDLAQLNRKFDIIECAGVLHHMNNPISGWKVLIDCLNPGGLMKIGLYSELARQHIVKIKQEISKSGIGANNAAMKSLRKSVMTSDQHHHKRLIDFPDFYSLSTLKDLLFHVQEHRFTISELKEYLHKLGLKFCGFESEKILSHFKQTNKTKDDLYDLDKWQAYEQANPSSFSGMYQFWCQKIDND